MLRRRRLTAVVSAALFLIAGTAEGTGVHRCPHHDALPAAVSDAPAAIHDASHHASHGAPESSEPASHDDCTCMGACQPAGVATPPDAGASAIAAPASAPEVDGWLPPAAPRATHVPFALPFANAPPVR